MHGTCNNGTLQTIYGQSIYDNAATATAVSLFFSSSSSSSSLFSSLLVLS